MKRTVILSTVAVCLMVPLSAFAQNIGGGTLTFSPKNAAPVVFSHEKHVAGKGLKCSGCHYQVFQMTQGSYKISVTNSTGSG